MDKESLTETTQTAIELTKEVVMLAILFGYTGVALYDLALLSQLIEVNSKSVEIAVLSTTIAALSAPFMKRNLWDYRD